MSTSVDASVIDRVRLQASDFVRFRFPVTDSEIAEAGVRAAEHRVPMPRMWDGLLWKILLWSSVALSVVFGIVFTAVTGTGSDGTFFGVVPGVFIMCIVPSLMIAFGFWYKQPARAMAQREEIRQAWILTANRQVILCEQEEAERVEAERMQLLLSRPSSPPDPQPFGVSPEGAERIVEAWMRHLGALDAEVTRYSGDGGIDVASKAWIAQVKHYQGVIGVAPIRELAGVTAVDGRRALFFTSTGYAAGASEFADRAGIGLFVYSAEDGTLTSVNGIADELYHRGLES